MLDGQSSSQYSMKDGYLMKDDCLCIIGGMRQKIMDERHAPPYAGHRGIASTTQALERYFYWPEMRKDLNQFVTECLTCQKVKYDRHQTPGLLMPLPVPDAPWESIAMDFIFELPRSRTGNDGIWTIIDRFSKQAHFIPIRKTIKADHMARVFIAQIFKHQETLCAKSRLNSHPTAVCKEPALLSNTYHVIILPLVCL